MSLFSPTTLGSIRLKNRAVMAPMTRCRAIGNVPGKLMADYYAQRASAGLIISEGIAPSPNALGYTRIPGLFSDEQIEGWRMATSAVHDADGRIFAQIMHTGRVSHPLNMPEGSEILAPSAIAAVGDMYTDSDGMQAQPVPRAMDIADIEQARNEFVTGARNAIAAGFDGVELHAANGYLLEQFLNPHVNVRTDSYGGSMENRARFVLETARAVADAIGADKVGIRLSPHSTFNDHPVYDGVAEFYGWLSEQLQEAGLVYVHLVLGGSGLPTETMAAIRQGYRGALMVNSGFDKTGAEAMLASGDAEFVSFGVPFIANPDLVERMQDGAEMARPNPDLFYAAGPEGYVDYPERSAA